MHTVFYGQDEVVDDEHRDVSAGDSDSNADLSQLDVPSSEDDEASPAKKRGKRGEWMQDTHFLG